MNYSSTYNSSYQLNGAYERSDNIVSFVKEFSQLEKAKGVDILEVGCGRGSLIPALTDGLVCGTLKAIDFSSVAIDQAKEYTNKVLFECEDILFYEDSMKYDLIIDSHLFHCLEGVQALDSYLLKVCNLLKPGGKFFLETMVAGRDFLNFHKENYNDSKLYIDGKFSRTILTNGELESLLLSSGLKITYLYFPQDLKMIPESGRVDPLPSDPDAVRVILEKE